MRVKATRLGYFNNRRMRPGDVFEIIERKMKVMEKGKLVEKILTVEDQFSAAWMEEVDLPVTVKRIDDSEFDEQPAPAASPQLRGRFKKVGTASQSVI